MTGLAAAGVSLLKEFGGTVTRHFISITLFVGIFCLLLLRLPKSGVDVFPIDGFRTDNSERIALVSLASLSVSIFASLHKITTRIYAKIKNDRRLEKEKQERELLLT
jgi:hypothetical protein